MTLGNAAARVRLIVWWSASDRARSRPDGCWYGAETSVLDWRERLVCSKCGSPEIDMVVTGTKGR
jgi:hypothetical protein